MGNENALERIRTVQSWYHVIEVAPGVETPGAYDMRPHLPRYGFPTDMTGWSVLDVGASNGFFSFHFEQLGARVVATELPDVADHDLPHWFREKKLAETSSDKAASINHHEVHGGFQVASELLQSSVEIRNLRIYDLPSEFPPASFDMAFCGSLLCHLRDPVAGLEAIRRVLNPNGILIVATPTDLELGDHPYGIFVGQPDLCQWWHLSPRALTRMCKMAGFAEAHPTDAFQLHANRSELGPQTIGVVHASAGG